VEAGAHGAMRSYWIHFNPDPPRNQTVNNEVDAIVYFPWFGVTEKVPLIVFAHGWGGAGDWYEFCAGALVPYGYVMVSVDVTRGLDNMPDDLAANQEYLVTAMLDQSESNQSSPIYQMLNGKAACAGHSNGGGSSLISQIEQPGNKYWQSFATLSALYPRHPEWQDALYTVTNPALIMTGTEDCVNKPDVDAYPIYNAIGSQCKYLINFVNATHCHFWEEKAPVEDIGCNQILEHNCYYAHIPIHQQFGLVAKYILPWFDYTLKGKDRLNLFDMMLKADADAGALIWEKSC